MPTPFDPNNYAPGIFDVKQLEANVEADKPSYRLPRQVVAGYADMLAAPPGTPLPGAIYQLLAAVEGAANYASSVLQDKGPAPNNRLGALLPTTEPLNLHTYQDIAASGLEQSNRWMGVDHPSDTAEMAARMATIIPGMAKIPNALKLLLPGIQAKTGLGKIAELGLTTGVSDILVNEADPNYKSVGELFMSDEPSSAVGTLPMVQPSDELKTSTLISGAMWGGLAALGGLSAYRAFQAQRRLDEVINASSTIGTRTPDKSMLATDLVGGARVTPKTSVVSRFGAVRGELVDRDAPLFDILRTAGRSDIEDRWRLTSQQPLAAKMQNIVNTGQLPNGVRTVSLRAHYDKLAKLSPAELAEYADTRNFQTIQDTMLANNQTVWFGHSFADLTTKIHRARSNPNIAALVDESNKFYHDFLTYMKDEGLIDNLTMTRYQGRTYSPIQAMDDTAVAKVMKSKNYDGGKFLLERELDLKPGEIAPPQDVDFQWINNMTRLVQRNSIRRDVIDTLANVQDPATKKVLAYRGKLDDTAIVVARNGKREAWHISDPVIDSVVRILPEAQLGDFLGKLADASKLGQAFTTGMGNPMFAAKAVTYDTLTAYTNAKPERAVGVIDEGLRRATGKTLSELGIPRADILTAAPAGVARRVYGRGVEQLTTAVRNSISNNGTIAQLLGPQKTAQLVDILTNASLNSTVGLMERTGADSSTFLATDALAGSRLAEAARKASPEFVKKYDPTIGGQIRAHPFFRMYSGVLSAFHKSVRTQFFAANIDRSAHVKHVQFGNRTIPLIEFTPSMTPAELNRVAAETRAFAGDTSRIAGSSATKYGRFVQGTQKFEPWGPVGIQAPRAFLNAIREHPFRVGVAMSALATAALTSIVNLSPESQEEYWTRWTPEQRARGMPLEVAGVPVGIGAFEPTHRPFMSALIETVGTMCGYKSGDTELQEFCRRALSGDMDHEALSKGLAVMGTETAQQDLKSGVLSSGSMLLPSWLTMGSNNPAVRSLYALSQYGDTEIKEFPTGGRYGGSDNFVTRDFSDPADPRAATGYDVVKAAVSELLMGAGTAATMTLDALTYPRYENDTQKLNAVSDAMLGQQRSASTQGVFAGLLPEGMTDPMHISRQTSEAKLLMHKRAVMGEITKMYNAYTQPALQGKAMLGRPRMEPLPPMRHELMHAGNIVWNANKQVNKAYEAVTSLLHRTDEVRGNYKIPGATKTELLNNYARQIQDLRSELYRFTADFETRIKDLGFEDFDDLYAQMRQPQQQLPPSAPIE